MKTHYFQRYSQKENVDTANTMLLLSRLYSYSSSYFFDFLSRILPNETLVEPTIDLQVSNKKTTAKNESSVPDAIISQPSFKIVVETKLYGNFDLTQLSNHLSSFSNEVYKVLLTLDPVEISEEKKVKIENVLNEYNSTNENLTRVVHKHLTFEKIIEIVSEIITYNDNAMNEVLEDFRESCLSSGLINNENRLMRVRTANETLKINTELGLYYERTKFGYSNHKFIGLYSNKSVRAIGEVVSVVKAKGSINNLTYELENGVAVNEDMIQRIKNAIEDAKKYGYDLENHEHRYFFVSEFVETDFRKLSTRSLRSSKYFNLLDILNIKSLPSNVKEIAALLKGITW